MATPKQEFSNKAGVSTGTIRRFMNAASAGDLKAVERAIKKYPDAVNWRDISNNTALHYAAGAGHTDTVAFLLDRGADIEARNMDDKMWGSVTPLICAAEWEKNLETVKLLAARGANLNAQTGQGETALMRAAQYSIYNVNKEKGEKIIRTLIALGADPSLKNVDGRTAFDIASKTAEPEAAIAIRDASAEQAALKAQQAQDDKRRSQNAIVGAFESGLAQPTKVLPPVQLKKEPPSPQ